jgi:hypothetical protein
MFSSLVLIGSRNPGACLPAELKYPELPQVTPGSRDNYRLPQVTSLNLEAPVTRHVLALIFVTFCAVRVAEAQSRPIRLGPSAAHFVWEKASSTPDAEPARPPLGGLLGRHDLDHRYTGFFVGAGLGLALTALNFAWCGEIENCNGAVVLPAGVLASGILGLSGAVVGGFLPKGKPGGAQAP